MPSLKGLTNNTHNIRQFLLHPGILGPLDGWGTLSTIPHGASRLLEELARIMKILWHGQLHNTAPQGRALGPWLRMVKIL